MGSMSACAVTENPSTYSYERGNSEKPDWMRSAVTRPTESALGASQQPADRLAAVSSGAMELVQEFRG